MCSIDDTVWDAVEEGWTKLEATKSTWDKATIVAANANSKALNAIFCGVSLDKFHFFSDIAHDSSSLILSSSNRVVSICNLVSFTFFVPS